MERKGCEKIGEVGNKEILVCDWRKYNRDLFREFLSYPPKENLKLFEDKKRLEKLEDLVMGWIDEDVNWVIKEYKEITKNWWKGAKEQAKTNLNKFLSGRADLV